MKADDKKYVHYTLTFNRVIIAGVILSHGSQKLLGWFGGYGFNGTMNFFTESIGLPWILGLAIIACESVGMLALAFGLYSRLLAAIVIVIMGGAIFTVHGQVGYYMNWSGNLTGEGFEYHILLIALALNVAINGGGAYALDSRLGRNIFREKK